MKRWLACLSRRSSIHSSSPATTEDTRGGTTFITNSPVNEQSVTAPQSSIPNLTTSETKETQPNSEEDSMENIISNHDFSQGLISWNPILCHAFVASNDSTYKNGIRPNSGCNYAIVTQRTQSWQGLEQDITDKIIPDMKYNISAFVRVLGEEIHDDTVVQATLKLENHDNSTNFLCISRVSVSKEKWEKLDGSFSLKSVPKRVMFYLEGPPHGIDLLIDSITISYKREVNENIITNHDFSNGIKPWRPNNCEAHVASDWSGLINGIKGHFGDNYAVVTKRTQNWQGLEQDITEKVKPGVKYYVSAFVRVFCAEILHGPVDVTATVRIENFDSSVNFLFIQKVSVGKDRWEKLESSFSLKTVPKNAVFYLEGPPAGLDLLIDCVKISSSPSLPPAQLLEQKPSSSMSQHGQHESLTRNPEFENGMDNWTGRGCRIARNDNFAPVSNIRALSNKYFAVATERRDTWHGIEQDITSRIERKALYTVKTFVRLVGSSKNSEVRVTLWYKGRNGREEFKGIAKGQVSDKDWVELQGKILVFNEIEKAVLFLEGPPAGTDILVNNFTVKRLVKPLSSPPPTLQNIEHGVNIIHNHDFNKGLTGWAPLGSCSLKLSTESPHSVPPNCYLNGRYIHCSARTETWMGPSQHITDKLKLYVTYLVSAWVRVGPSRSVQKVNVALSVDDQWVNGGTVNAGTDKWYEVKGSFRLEKKPNKVTVYVQGPEPRVDLKVMGLRIIPNNRKARFDYLKDKTDKVRKRDVILKFQGSKNVDLKGASVKIAQVYNSFPFGTCIGRYNVDHEDLADFFVKNFNWAVFENELKWYWTEAEKGKINYHDSDYLVEFCERNNIQLRGHCIFWEVDDSVQPWLKTLDNNELMKSVNDRLRSLLTRYKGRFKHHDVNNEMLHGSFYKNKLGDDIWAYMFKEAHKLDPNAVLFVNDYNVEDGCDPKSTPEKYIEQILDLNEKGAKVGGIGVQGHITNPIGEIICDSFDKLGVLGIPIWITELDVCSENEFVRADDLEVVLREAFAHPSVEGIVFWGFWELFMWRENAHLVDADGTINEAGKRFLDLKREWMSNSEGRVDGASEFGFRGFHGGYNVEVMMPSGERVFQSFVVEKGETPLVLDIKV